MITKDCGLKNEVYDWVSQRGVDYQCCLALYSPVLYKGDRVRRCVCFVNIGLLERAIERAIVS